MTQEAFAQICKQVVVDMSYKSGKQINTFGVTRGEPGFGSDTLGYDYQDFLDETFWARTWVNQKAAPEKMQAEFPLLLIENLLATMPDLSGGELVYEWHLLLIDKLACESCPPSETRTPEQVKQNVLWMLRNFLQELGTYQLWELQKNGQSVFEWISAGRMEYYNDNPQLNILPVSLEQELSIILINDNIELREWGRFNYSEYRAYFTTLRFQVCDPLPAGNFNYDNPTIKQLSYTVCPC